MQKILENIKRYGNRKSNYVPFIGGVFYPMNSQEFIRTGFMEICPAITARDHKDPKRVLVKR